MRSYGQVCVAPPEAAPNGEAPAALTAPPCGDPCAPSPANPEGTDQAAPQAAAQTAESTAAEGAAIGTQMGTAAAAAAAATALQSSSSGPGQTAAPAGAPISPLPPGQNPITQADKSNWAALDKAGIQCVGLGEFHFTPEQMQAEERFADSAYTHGFRNVILEYPAAKQKQLDRFLKDPSYQNMAELASGYAPDDPNGNRDRKKHSNLIKRYAVILQKVDSLTRSAAQAFAMANGVDPEAIDGLRAQMQMFRLWRHFYKTGYKVIGGDLDRNIGLDQNGNLIVNSPSRPVTDAELMRFLASPRGMKDRNLSIAAFAAQVTKPNARTIVIGGVSHMGFLPNERIATTSKPNEIYPGLNYLLENIYHIPSVAIVQSAITPQGFLAELGLGYFSPPAQPGQPAPPIPHLTPQQVQAIVSQRNQQAAANIALDPGRTPYDPLSGKPIDHSLSEAVNRRASSVPQGP
ncbi:hypothetical protein [Methylacidimicrobium sp. AP8]|uniref:hypothetical protein n=1 Tax=Methylacidimicrobium sp. AP8 TaxID=2730359 RepID=UPI001925080A|nr:hypothetical protein [Methylacidimicrobium sp. AP8]